MPAVLGDGENDEDREKLQARFFEARLHRRGSKKGTNSQYTGKWTLTKYTSLSLNIHK